MASGLSMTHKKETMLMLVNSLTKDGGHLKHMRNYQKGCKNAFLYQDKCIFIKRMDAYSFHTLYAGYFFSSCIFVVCVFNNLLKKSTTEEHPQIVKQFGPDQFNKLSGLIWTKSFCKDNKQKSIAILTHW